MRISDWSSDVCSSDLVACWAHFRRKIFECHQTSPTPLTTDLLTRIAGLYRIEEDVRGQPPDIRRRQRQEQARPQIDALRGAIDAALRRPAPKPAMAKALAYGRKRRSEERRGGKEWVSTCRYRG